MRRLKRSVELNLNYFLLGRTPLLVYSMERSGSVALFRSLCLHGEFALITHYMDPQKLVTEPQSGSARWAYKHLIGQRKPTSIISLVRNPIENMLSIFARAEFSKKSRNQKSPAGPAAQDVSEHFRKVYLAQQRHLRQLDWFETEFKPVTEIDVYNFPFDKGDGFLQFQAGSFQVLILRTELGDERKAQLISEFLGLTKFTMQKANGRLYGRRKVAPGMPGEQSDYAARYKVLRKNVRFSDEYLDAIIGSRYVQHFFPQDEIDTMKDWFRTPTGSPR